MKGYWKYIYKIYYANHTAYRRQNNFVTENLADELYRKQWNRSKLVFLITHCGLHA